MHIILENMKSIATRAGDDALEKQRNCGKITCKSKGQFVTEVDTANDKYIIQALRQVYPTANFLTEETYPCLDRFDMSSKKWFIVDPIDGTTNYSKGSDYFAVSIAYMEDGEVKYGVVYRPSMKQMFYAIKGGGAFLNGEKLDISNSDLTPDRALIAVGYDLKGKNCDELHRCFNDIRRLGAGTIDISSIARGVVDGFHETVKPWDVAASVLIAKEAGARVGFAHGYPKDCKIPKDIFSEGIIVANPRIFEQLVKLLKEANN